MRRRVFAAIAAVLLAGVGAVLLTGYVGNADRRALAGMQPTDVLVVTSRIPEGTTAKAMAKLVTTKTLPAVSVADGALTSLTAIQGQVATTDLEPGEQLLASRFADPATLTAAGAVPVPHGFQQVTMALDRQRVLGGRLTAGATVGVFLSLPKDGDSLAQTHLLRNSVLVTQVDGDTPTSGSTTGDGDGDASSTSSGASLMVTFAVSARDAEALVYGAEYGTLWLSLEPAGAVVTGTRVVNRTNVTR